LLVVAVFFASFLFGRRPFGMRLLPAPLAVLWPHPEKDADFPAPPGRWFFVCCVRLLFLVFVLFVFSLVHLLFFFLFFLPFVCSFSFVLVVVVC